jgi:hypothetical protein
LLAHNILDDACGFDRRLSRFARYVHHLEIVSEIVSNHFARVRLNQVGFALISSHSVADGRYGTAMDELEGPAQMVEGIVAHAQLELQPTPVAFSPFAYPTAGRLVVRLLEHGGGGGA